MAQNIYDREDFYTAYITHIDRSDKESDLSTDPAWTRLSPLLPPVKNTKILDLGCGTGWFARWAAKQGAQSILATDISERMLARARELTQDTCPQIKYRRDNLDGLPAGSLGTGYDLAFSSLALHYLTDLDGVMALVHDALRPGGLFVFNVEHPIYTAPYVPRVVVDGETGDKSWNLNHYYREGERVVDWLAEGVRKQHRTVTTYMRAVLGAGFEVVGFVEFLPTDEELANDAVDEIEGIRPLFLMMSVRKRG
jgi:SAM-dependent methyltransferase